MTEKMTQLPINRSIKPYLRCVGRERLDTDKSCRGKSYCEKRKSKQAAGNNPKSELLTRLTISAMRSAARIATKTCPQKFSAF